MATRMQYLNINQRLVTEVCCDCGVLFAMPDELHDKLVDKPGTAFYCPNGHSQHYVGKTEAQKLKEQLERREQELARRQAQLDQARAEAEHQAAVARGYKGAAAKARKRAAKGVCPAPGCKRSFVDVARHVSTCHPELGTDAAILDTSDA